MKNWFGRWIEFGENGNPRHTPDIKYLGHFQKKCPFLWNKISVSPAVGIRRVLLSEKYLILSVYNLNKRQRKAFLLYFCLWVEIKCTIAGKIFLYESWNLHDQPEYSK
jgi:hypothetical protein